MFDRSNVLSTAFTVALAALPLSNAGAAPAFRVAAFDIPAVAGAMNESRSLARSAEEVRAQGGFVTVAAVRWLAKAPADSVQASVIHVPSVIGAMNESRSVARSAVEVRNQGGFATAAAVQWLAQAPGKLKLAAF